VIPRPPRWVEPKGLEPLTPTLPARQDHLRGSPLAFENPVNQGLQLHERTYEIRSERPRTATLATNLATRPRSTTSRMIRSTHEDCGSWRRCCGASPARLLARSARGGRTGIGRWRRWMRTARCDGGVARPLHAKITNHRRTDRRGPVGPTESGRVERRGLPSLAFVGGTRRAIDDSPLRRPARTGTRSRTSPVVGRVLGDFTPFDSTAPCGPLRACIHVVPEPSEDRLRQPAQVPRNPKVYRCIAPNGFRTGATALRDRTGRVYGRPLASA
jgi:hypothetical protein